MAESVTKSAFIETWVDKEHGVCVCVCSSVARIRVAARSGRWNFSYASIRCLEYSAYPILGNPTGLFETLCRSTPFFPTFPCAYVPGNGDARKPRFVIARCYSIRPLIVHVRLQLLEAFHARIHGSRRMLLEFHLRDGPWHIEYQAIF